MIKHKLLMSAAMMALVALGTSAAEAKTLRFSDYGPNRGARAETLQWFADELERRSEGALQIEFFWGGSLLGGRDTLRGLSDGVADMGTIVGFFTPSELRAYNIGDLPLESDMWIGLRSMYDLARTNETLSAEFDDAGVRYVTNYTTGPIQLICNTKVESLDELSGLRIRASGPYGDTLASLGAEVSQMSQADVYQALDSGLIDCNQNYYYAIEAYRQYEVADHVLELDWGQNMSFGIFMNEGAYDGLSDDERAVLEDVASDYIDHLAKVMVETDTRAKEAMVEGIDGASVTTSRLSDEDRQKLNEAAQPAIAAWAASAKEQGIDGDALLGEYESLLDRYREVEETDGYPWTR